jgi:hypothetical protein
LGAPGSTTSSSSRCECRSSIPSVESYLAYRRAFGQLADGTVEVADERRALASCAEQHLDAAGRLVLDWQLLVISARRARQGRQTGDVVLRWRMASALLPPRLELARVSDTFDEHLNELGRTYVDEGHVCMIPPVTH